MTAENQKKFNERFSFLGQGMSIQVALTPHFGFECDDGWFDLLWKLCEGIEKILDKPENAEFKKDFYVAQVKEKFGDLRFYTSYETDEISALIRIAENESAVTCEECGQPAVLCASGHWYRTVCPEHAKRNKGMPCYRPVGDKGPKDLLDKYPISRREEKDGDVQDM